MYLWCRWLAALKAAVSLLIWMKASPEGWAWKKGKVLIQNSSSFLFDTTAGMPNRARKTTGSRVWHAINSVMGLGLPVTIIPLSIPSKEPNVSHTVPRGCISALNLIYKGTTQLRTGSGAYLRVVDHVDPVVDNVLGVVTQELEEMFHLGLVGQTPQSDAVPSRAHCDHLLGEGGEAGGGTGTAGTARD